MNESQYSESRYVQVLAEMRDAFPRQEFPPATARVYHRNLTDIDIDILDAAVTKLIRTEEFLPSIAKIRTTAAELALALPTESEALQQIKARQEWTRADVLDPYELAARENDAPRVAPLVQQALDQVGGWHAFRAADNPSVVRGQFGRIYRDLRQAAVTQAAASTGGIRG